MTNRNIEVSRPTKLEVRQRCGFGCILCGLPIYQYDHMHGYSESTADVPEEITLLCPNHHADKTLGRLPLEKVLQANDAPVNVKTGVSSPYGFHYQGGMCTIGIAQSQFIGVGHKLTALLMRDEEVISFDFSSDGQLFLNANIRDRSGELVFSVQENEMLYSSRQWDIEYVGQTLTVRQGQRDILFELKFGPPSRIDLTRANLAYGNVAITVDATAFHVEGPPPRIRHVERYTTYGIQYAIVLDCDHPPLGAGLRL
jgi:trigger factor